ncbi:MAG: hypothetical protein WB777_14295 [Mycobacterium sp.]
MDAQDLINATRRRMKAGVATEDQLNVLAQPYSPGDDTLSFTYPMQGLQPGTRMSASLNQYHLWAVSANNKTATVTGGMDGAPDLPLTAGTLVRVRPRWTDFEILDDLNNDLSDLSGHGLYQVLTTEVTFNAAVNGYDLGNLQVIHVLGVFYQTPGPYKNWPRIDHWELRRNADTTDFPSGLALQVNGFAYTGRPVQVMYASPFTPLGTDLSQDIGSTGLPLTAFDLPPYGAAIALQSGTDIERTRLDTQGDTRRSDEVQVGSPGQAVGLLRQQRQERISTELTRLQALYPARWH